MILPNESLRSNAPLTSEEAARLRETISSCQIIIDAMMGSLKFDELEVSTQKAAIGRLEVAISATEEGMWTQQETLSSLVKMKANLDSITDMQDDWTGLPEVNMPGDTTIADLNHQLKLNSTKLDESISKLKEYIPRLSISIREMNTELSNRQLMRDTLTQYISDTRNHKSAIERNIKILRSMLHNVRHIPAEIWAKIFSLRVHGDMGEFFAHPQTDGMPVTTIKLSHVSRFWRRVVLSQRSLWRFIPLDRRESWTLPTLELFRHFLSCSGRDATLVCNLSQEGRYHRNWSLVGAEETSVLDAYALHMVYNGYSNGDPSLIPFRQPKILKLQFSAEPYGLETLFDTFSEISTLEIINKDHHTPVEMVSLAVQQLIYLKLDMTTFDPFDHTTYLGSNLEELHIKHNGISSISPSSISIRLSRLKVLGVTPPDTDFVQSLDLPALKKIILHGPKSSNIAILSLVQFSDNPNLKGVRNLEIREWPLFKHKMEDEWSVMTPVGGIVDKMRSIESLRCVDSVINGLELVKLVSALKDPTNTTCSKLEHVVIDCCTGITREQCDAVGALVGKMEVYV